mmetsp:Transcript_8061/g.17361  ORF Transcript_8061/g.17361 Transcript_8061/m.17361 type:complete len:255 (+) Transcript_8061:1343-2107(+)
MEAKTTLLVSNPGTLDSHKFEGVTVDADLPSINQSCNSICLFRVFGINRTAKTILRVIRQSHSFFLGSIKFSNCDYRAKGFFGKKFHVFVNIRQDRHWIELSTTILASWDLALMQEFGSFGKSVFHLIVHVILLDHRYHGTYLIICVHPVANLVSLRGRLAQFLKFIIDRIRYIDPFDRATHLSGIRQGVKDSILGSLFQICIGTDNHWILPTHFQNNPLEQWCSGLQNFLSRGGTAGHGYQIDSGMCNQSSSH